MTARLDETFVQAAREELRREGIDAWLLYDLEARNRVSAGLIGVPEGMSRRYFVRITPDGEPHALVHSVEFQHWPEWPHGLTEYVSWGQLEEELGKLVGDLRTVAMEVSEGDAVPWYDNVPHGVVQMVEAVGPKVVSSGPLISGTIAQWGEVGYRTHHRASGLLAETARAAFDRACEAAKAGSPLTEYQVSRWITERLEGGGLTEVENIVATGANSANPHYFPVEDSPIITLDAILMIDLWGKSADEPEAVFADTTWMGFTGSEPPDAFMQVWEAAREGRDAAPALIAARVSEGQPPTGADVDQHVRDVITRHGFKDQIVHRTGHAIDRLVHGFGPNLDAVETRETRRLIPGIGFSDEPGLYFRGRFGVRTETNIFMREDGPEVTTPNVQEKPWLYGA